MHVFAQIYSSGKVLHDVRNEPQIVAQIVLDTAGGAVMDKNVNFSLNLRSGNFSGFVNILGYGKKGITINNQNNDIGTIELHLCNTTLDEVIVNASPKSFKGGFKGWTKYVIGKFLVNLSLRP